MTPTSSTDVLTPAERWLVRLEDPVGSAVYRAAIGFLMLPSAAWLGADGSAAALAAYFLITLFAIRAVPAVLRKLLPFPPAVLRVWATRRFIAKRHDSYQWKKLLWIGVGMLAYAAYAGRGNAVSLVLSGACLGAGLAGTWVWRTRGERSGKAECSRRPELRLA